MQQIKLLFLGALAVFALSATIAASAYAGTEALSAEGKPTTFTLAGVTEKVNNWSILANSLEIKCGITRVELRMEGEGRLGTFHLAQENCSTNLGGECTGLGDAAKSTLLLGTWHLASNTGLTVGYVLYLVEHVHFSCTVLGIARLFLMLGELLCQVTPTNTLTSKLAITCQKGAERGDPAVTSYENGNGEATTLTNALQVSEGDTTETMAAEEESFEFAITPQVKLDI